MSLDTKRPHALIVANPQDHAPTPGSTFRYRLDFREMDASILASNPEEVEGPEPLPDDWAEEFRKANGSADWEKVIVQQFKEHLHWYVIWDRQSQDWKQIKKKEKNNEWRKIRSGSFDCKIKWSYRGKHIVVCILGSPSGQDVIAVHKRHPTLVQHVSSVHVVHSKAIKRQKRNPAHPIHTLNVVSRTIEVLEDGEHLGKKASKKELAEYKKKLKALKDYKSGMEQLFPDWELLTGADHLFIPIFASYVAKETSQQQDMRLCLEVPFKLKSTRATVKVYDWTNPQHSRLRGVFSATEDSLPVALGMAMRKWEEKRKDQHAYFHPGHFQWEILNQKVGAHELPFTSGVFDTEGPGFWDQLSDFFSAAALPATLAALLSSVLPFPGARAVAGALWTYVFSSTTANAVIRIGLRHSDGIHSIKDDAMDFLEVAGSLFGAAQLKWVQRAVFTKTVSGSKQRFLLYGDVGATGIEGVVVAAEHAQEFVTIMENETLTPSERLDRLLSVFGRGLASAAMTYISVRSSKSDLKALNKQLNAEHLEKLSRKTTINDPSQDVDLDERSTIKRHTDDERVLVKKEDDEIETPTARNRRSKKTGGGQKARRVRKDFPQAKSAAKRGMRDRDDRTFKEMAEKGDIIIVRNSNPAAAEHIGKKGKKPKPPSLKAKTRQTPPNRGLAAADPDDPRLQAMLKEEGIDYPTYKAQLAHEGFHVGEPSEGFVIRDGNGNMFYSDYDLHGIYDAETGRDTYTEGKRKTLNDKLVEPLIQHGPHDHFYPDGHQGNGEKKVGPYGPQPPCTAYTPDGKAHHLETIQDMKAFYEEHGIDWAKMYPKF